jgi:hypothetical protein
VLCALLGGGLATTMGTTAQADDGLVSVWARGTTNVDVLVCATQPLLDALPAEVQVTWSVTDSGGANVASGTHTDGDAWIVLEAPACPQDLASFAVTDLLPGSDYTIDVHVTAAPGVPSQEEDGTISLYADATRTPVDETVRLAVTTRGTAPVAGAVPGGEAAPSDAGTSATPGASGATTATTTPAPSTTPTTTQTADDLATLLPRDLRALPARVIAEVPADVVAQWTPAQVRALRPVQVRALSVAAIRALRPAALAAISVPALRSLSADRARAVTPAQRSALGPLRRAALAHAASR